MSRNNAHIHAVYGVRKAGSMKRILCVFLMVIVLSGCKGRKNTTSETVNDVSVKETEESSAVLEDALTDEQDFYNK